MGFKGVTQEQTLIAAGVVAILLAQVVICGYIIVAYFEGQSAQANSSTADGASDTEEQQKKDQ